jgi:crotonobetainyl-CoA hydratase
MKDDHNNDNAADISSRHSFVQVAHSKGAKSERVHCTVVRDKRATIQGKMSPSYVLILEDTNKPIIVAVNGMAVGGGFEIAMAADFIVAADHAQFFLPETRVGVLPDAGAVRLPRLMPRQLSNEIIFGGRRLSAVEAESWGIVNRVVPLADLMTSARQLAAEICLSAPLGVAAVLELNRTLENVDIQEAMKQMRVNAAYRKAVDSQDAVEGPTSFAEKRPPQWQGK